MQETVKADAACERVLLSFDHYLGKMEELVNDKKVPARVRYLIQDVIEGLKEIFEFVSTISQSGRRSQLEDD